MITTQTVLIDARNLISDPACWTRGSYARLLDGTPRADVTYPGVSSWCMYGAVRWAALRVSLPVSAAQMALEQAAKPFIAAWWNALSKSEQDKTHPTIPCWQDHPSTTHTDVLKVFDAAIDQTDS